MHRIGRSAALNFRNHFGGHSVMVAVIRQDVMALKKRFQIFISSTFADLRDERDEIANAIQAMGHIPAGMELFGSDADDS